MDQKIRIDEENIRLLWGLLIVLTLSAGIYLVGNIVWSQSLGPDNIRLIISLLLFGIGFYSIIQISRPLFHFILAVDGQTLAIEVWKDEETLLDTQTIALSEIAELRIAPHHPRKPNEALFDFSTNFHLLYRSPNRPDYHTLIHLEQESFTLKVEDIRKIIRFLSHHNPNIRIDDDQMNYFWD